VRVGRVGGVQEFVDFAKRVLGIRVVARGCGGSNRIKAVELTSFLLYYFQNRCYFQGKPCSYFYPSAAYFNYVKVLLVHHAVRILVALLQVKNTVMMGI